MHPASLAIRNQEARRRITAAAAKLGEALGVSHLEQPTAIEQRQPAIAQMRELEHIADLLDRVTAVLVEDTSHA